MKKYLLLLLFYFGSSNAQNYIPLLQDGNVWWEIEADTSGNTNLRYIKYKLSVQGEITINGHIYKKINRSSYAACSICPDGPFGNSYYPYEYDEGFLYMREDIPNKKVFLFYNPNLQEILAYDFSLNVGDTIPKNLREPHNINNTDPNYGIITQITFANIFGRIRKVFKIYYIPSSQGQPDETLYIIEGIGNRTSLLSLPDSDKIFELGFYSECFEDVANGKNCDRNLTLAAKNTDIKGDAQLTYSKTNGVFRILGKEKIYTVYFYDSLGRKIETFDNISNGKTFKLVNKIQNSMIYYFIKGDLTEKVGKILLP